MKVVYTSKADVLADVLSAGPLQKAKVEDGLVIVDMDTHGEDGGSGGKLRLRMAPLTARQFAYIFADGASRADGKPPASYGRHRPS